MRRFAAIALATLLAACTVVSIDEDQDRRAQREADFDAPAFVARNWNSRIVPEIEKDAIPIETLLPAIAKDLTAAGQAQGRMASEGSPWVFKVRGSGKVAQVDIAPQHGNIPINLAGGGKAYLLTGPVLVSSAVRDALPFIDFNNFADQMAFAAVNKALNERALKSIPPALKAGDPVTFVGVAAVSQSDAPLEIIAVKIGSAD